MLHPYILELSGSFKFNFQSPLFMNILVFAFIPLILSIGIIPSLQSEIIPSVNAIKAKGNSLTETNSKKVCGDRLCSEISDNQRTSTSMMTKSQKTLFASTMDYTVTGPEIDPEKGYAVIEIGDGASTKITPSPVVRNII